MRLLALAALSLLAFAAVAGCTTSEIKNENAIGLVDDVAAGTKASGYGDGHGDSIGQGGGHAQSTETRQEDH